MSNLTFDSASGSSTFRSFSRGRQTLYDEEELDHYTEWTKLNDYWEYRIKYYNRVIVKANVVEYTLVLPKGPFEFFCDDMDTLTWIVGKLNIPYVSNVSEVVNDGITVYKFLSQKEQELHLGYMYTNIQTTKEEKTRDEFRRIE